MPFLLNLMFTASSAALLLTCILLGIGYSALLYSKKTELNNTQLRLLSGLRALVVALIAFLLFAPYVKSISRTREKPIVVVAQDNSASINLSKAPGFEIEKYSEDFGKLLAALKEDFDVKTFQFGNDIQSRLDFTFRDKTTDVSSVFKQLNERFQNRNIGAVILASDGIYNKGGNPQADAQKLTAPVYTVALGDTTPKKDILISAVRHNDIVYLNNQFEVEVKVEAYLGKGASGQLTIFNSSGQIASKALSVNSDDFQTTVPFVINADKKGMQKFTARVFSTKGELSEINNQITFYVDVIDGRQKILLVANAPHPDVTALKQSIEENKNYEVEVVLANELKPADVSSSTLLILHQVPSAGNQVQSALNNHPNMPVWFILGSQSDIPAFNSAQSILNIAFGGSIQETFPAVRSDFYEFSLSEPTRKQLANFAPLLVPYGQFTANSNSAVLLGQKIGRVETERPLLVFSEGSPRKTAVLAGEGIWRWKLNDFETSGNHSAVNELINKTIQYLSAAEDKRKFRVFTSKNTYEENEKILFNAELYNDNYEQINTPDVNLTVKNSSGKSYSFLFSKVNGAYELDAGTLHASEYSYTANTTLGSKNYSFSGKFTVTERQAEYVNTIANHQLLFVLAQESGGKLFYPDRLNDLLKDLKEDERLKVIIHEDKLYRELVDVKWIFVLLLALLSFEWFVRKRYGEV